MKDFIFQVLLPVFVGFIVISFLFSLIKENEEEGKQKILIEVRRIADRAYFEGQKDALNGDIRIQKIDSCYYWKKSPWDDGTKPVFQPNENCK